MIRKRLLLQKRLFVVCIRTSIRLRQLKHTGGYVKNCQIQVKGCRRDVKTEGRRQKAVGSGRKATGSRSGALRRIRRLPPASYLLLLPVYYQLPTAFCLLPSAS